MADKTKFALTYHDVKRLMPDDFLRIMTKNLGGKRGWSTPIDVRTMFERHVCLEDILLIAAEMAKADKDIHMCLILFAADCAANTLSYHRNTTKTAIIKDVIGVAHRFVWNQINTAELANLSKRMFWLARRIGLETADITDWQAAMACLKVIKVNDAAEAITAAWAAEFAAAKLGPQQSADEREWQKERIVGYLSDPPFGGFPLLPNLEGQ